ncbi:MAG: ABC transporter permease [Alphaproteobacteria bacterium]|nr:ABC transporter permease [Alphaproteobacteria bacterium]
MGRAFHLARLELKRYFADRADLAFGIALPIVLFAVMTGALGENAGFRATMHVADLDGGPLAHRILGQVNDSESISVRRYTRDELADALRRTAILTGFVIPPGFSASIESGIPASIVVEQRGSGGDEGQIVVGVVREAARKAVSAIELRRAIGVLAGDSAGDERVDEVVQQLLTEAHHHPSVEVVTDPMHVPEASELDRLLAGIVVMFLLFSATLSARALIAERRSGTLERLVTTQLSPGELFIGKFLGGVGRAMVQSFLLLGLAFAVLGVAGPLAFAQCLILALVVAATVTSVGLVVAALARTDEQAAFSAVLVTMIMSVFGGTFFPTAGAGWLEVLSRFSLNTYAVDAFMGLFSGTGRLADQELELAVLGGVAITGLVIARTMFRVSSSPLQS